MSRADDHSATFTSRALEILSEESAGLRPMSPVTGPLVGASGADDLRREIAALVHSVPDAATARVPARFDTDMVPTISAAGPVHAGDCAELPISVTNEDTVERAVTLFATNLVSESGHEIPSLRLTVVPRQAVLAPAASASFTVRVTVPPQSAPGQYAGLLQAAGAKYVKAVISVEVL